MTFLEKQIRTRVKTFETDNIDIIKEELKPYLISIEKILPKKKKYEVVYKCYKASDPIYDVLVNGMVRDRYTESEEFAILRKSINNPYNTEFIEYNNYVEQCKLQAKAFIEERKSLLGK